MRLKKQNATVVSRPGKFSTRKLLTYAASVLLLAGAGATSVRAEYLTNGTFEIEPLDLDSSANTFPGWTEAAGTAAVDAPAAISGNHSAKLISVSAGTLQQTLVDTNNALSQWIFETDFACNNPGGNRSFNPRFAHTEAGFNQINLRVVDSDGNGVGDVQCYNNSSWVTVLANAVTFSDSDTSLNVNHLKIVGHYSDATPNYDVYVTDAANVTQSALNQTHFHGTKPAPGAALRVMSFETGNYKDSSLFSVVDNVTITSFGSVDNPVIVTSQPASKSVLQGASSVAFTAGLSGTPPFFAQWQFNGNDIEGATNATATSSVLTLTNITPDQAGTYTLVVSNAFGSTVSSNAVLTVTPVNNTAQMTTIWNLLPEERPYLAAANNTERGIAYNPISDSVLIASRAGGSNSVAVLDPSTGADKHLMNVSGVGGGDVDISMIGVADDGVVFAGNVTVNASAKVFTLYRWDDDSESSSPVQVFIGDPGDPIEPGIRWGDNMAVRGEGADTQILLAPGGGTNVALLRTVSGFNFQTEIPPTIIAVSNVPSGFAQSAISFGPGTNTFWAKAAGQPLRLIQFDLETQTGVVLQTYSGSAVPGSVIGIAANKEQTFLAGTAIDTPDNVRLYDISNVTADPVLRDQELFTTDNANPTLNGTGSAAFGGDRLFVLDSNNGVKAFLIDTNFVPPAATFGFTGVKQDGSSIVVTWETESGRTYQLQSKDSLSDSAWTNVGSPIAGTGSPVSATNIISSDTRFFRLEAQ